MRFLEVHKKQLPVPSFFQVYNFGGGRGDKDREIVYSELTSDTPALINYFYINNKYPHHLQSEYFDDLSNYDTIGDVYNDIRRKLINDKSEIYTAYNSQYYDFNNKVFLLDSGAFNIVKQIAFNVSYDTTKFKTTLIEHMKDYYDFADKLKVDIVVGFDLGGKYTEKDNEKGNKALNNFLAQINAEEINNMLLEETIKYISSKQEYYPYVLATIHGRTQANYGECVDYVLELEKRYNYRFWGFALGGIASYKQVDHSWHDDIDFKETKKKGFVGTVTPARACRIVRNKVGDRPIHALGCGGYFNIALNYYCGATSFDAASPVRRVGDGSFESTKLVYDTRHFTTNEVGFSQYFVGGINVDNTMRTEPCIYVNINEVKDSMNLCGCKACQVAGTVKNIKDLYAMKDGMRGNNDEANYLSRQLMGLHAVNQHRKLCERIADFDNIFDFSKAYPNDLFRKLTKIYVQL